MSYMELFLLAAGLSFDTFAVSFCGGLSLKDKKTGAKVWIYICFAFFQTSFTLTGWVLGMAVESYIQSFDHWIAAGLLWYIGGKMVVEGFRNKGCEAAVNLLDTKYLIVSSVATSIDALAAGISFAMIRLETVRLIAGLAMIALVTAFASLMGINGGNRIGKSCVGRRSELLGGLILVAIGIKILIGHLIV